MHILLRFLIDFSGGQSFGDTINYICKFWTLSFSNDVIRGKKVFDKINGSWNFMTATTNSLYFNKLNPVHFYKCEKIEL